MTFQKNTHRSCKNFIIYAYEEELAKGFVTINGGHRVGVCGKAVVKRGDADAYKRNKFLSIYDLPKKLRLRKPSYSCSDRRIQTC